MTIPLTSVLDVALIFGGAGFLARSVYGSRSTSIEDLVEQIDKTLVKKLYVCHEDYALGIVSHGQAVWAAIGGARGLPRFLAQTRLQVRIVFMMRRRYPGRFNSEVEHVRGVSFAIFMGAIGALWEHWRSRWHPHMTRIATFLCAEAFVHLAAEVETSISLYSFLATGSM